MRGFLKEAFTLAAMTAAAGVLAAPAINTRIYQEQSRALETCTVTDVLMGTVTGRMAQIVGKGLRNVSVEMPTPVVITKECGELLVHKTPNPLMIAPKPSVDAIVSSLHPGDIVRVETFKIGPHMQDVNGVESKSIAGIVEHVGKDASIASGQFPVSSSGNIAVSANTARHFPTITANFRI
jgi:hypothetical protein